jgi:hypothetical protein
LEYAGIDVFEKEMILLSSLTLLHYFKYNKPMSIVENLYNIIGIAATKFNPEQLDYLMGQINQVI